MINPASGISTSWSDWLDMKRQGWTTAWIAVDDLGRVSLGSVPPPGYIDPNAPAETGPIQEPFHLALPGTPPKRQRPACLPEKTETRSLLSGRLQILQSKAWQSIGRPATITLANGLRIDLVVEKSGTYRLLLARQEAEPGDRELSTVLAHWPDPVPETSATERFEHGGWKCLKVTW